MENPLRFSAWTIHQDYGMNSDQKRIRLCSSQGSELWYLAEGPLGAVSVLLPAEHAAAALPRPCGAPRSRFQAALPDFSPISHMRSGRKEILNHIVYSFL